MRLPEDEAIEIRGIDGKWMVVLDSSEYGLPGCGEIWISDNGNLMFTIGFKDGTKQVYALLIIEDANLVCKYIHGEYTLRGLLHYTKSIQEVVVDFFLNA
jgi:hypothetical protein